MAPEALLERLRARLAAAEPETRRRGVAGRGRVDRRACRWSPARPPRRPRWPWSARPRERWRRFVAAAAAAGWRVRAAGARRRRDPGRRGCARGPGGHRGARGQRRAARRRRAPADPRPRRDRRGGGPAPAGPGRRARRRPGRARRPDGRRAAVRPPRCDGDGAVARHGRRAAAAPRCSTSCGATASDGRRALVAAATTLADVLGRRVEVVEIGQSAGARDRRRAGRRGRRADDPDALERDHRRRGAAAARLRRRAPRRRSSAGSACRSTACAFGTACASSPSRRGATPPATGRCCAWRPRGPPSGACSPPRRRSTPCPRPSSSSSPAARGAGRPPRPSRWPRPTSCAARAFAPSGSTTRACSRRWG